MVLEINDEQALSQASQGDREAFGVLYDRYVVRIYNYIFYRTGNQHDAEDLTSKVFARAMKHITNYQNRGVPFSAWLYRIAHNLVANWHRDNSRKQEVGLDDSYWVSSDIEMPENILVRSEQRDDLLEIIKTLPDDRQLLLVLKFVDHLSNAEIGRIMERTEGAIKSLYHRTLLALRDDIKNNSTGLDFLEKLNEEDKPDNKLQK